MKKVLATLVLVLVASTVSAAEVKVGAWGRGFFVPFYSDGASDAISTDAVSWGTPNPRVGMTITGTSDNAGFQVDFNGDGGTINGGDQQMIWVKPIDMLTVKVGRVMHDNLRGNGTFGDFDWLRITGTGEDLTFARVSTYDGSGYGRGGQGAVFALDPMKELHAYLAFKSLGGANVRDGVTANRTAGPITVTDAMKNITVGAGYTIGTIGQARAQYIGNVAPELEKIAAVPATATTAAVPAVAKVDAVDKSAINAAFKLTAVPNLLADFGFFMPTKSDDAGYDMKVAAYVKYTMGAIGIHALANVEMGKVYNDFEKAGKTTDGMGMEIGLGLDYAIGNGLGLVSSVRYQNEASANVKDGRIGALVGVEKGFSNGKIGGGVEFSTTSLASMPEKDDGKTIATEEMSIAVPVKVEYWF